MNVNELIVYDLLKWTFGPLASMLLRVRCEGADNVPDEGGAVLVGNHRQPILDPLIVAVKIERPITWGGYEVVYKIPVVRSLARFLGVVPLKIEGGKKARDALEILADVARQGEVVGLFPEGDRAVTQLRKASQVFTFHTGFCRIALRARVPVIPAAIIVHEEIHLPNIPPFITRLFWDHPEFKKTGHPVTIYNRVTVRIGTPIDLSGYYDRAIDRQMLGQISGKVRRIVGKLYNGEDLDRFMYGREPFDISTDRV